MKRGKPQADNPWVMFHMGLEFAGAAVILTLIGWYFVDLKFDTGPWGALTGFAIGFIGGFYLFIKEALLANRLAQKHYKEGLRSGLTGKPSLMKGVEHLGKGIDGKGDEPSSDEASEDEVKEEENGLPGDESLDESDKSEND
ncbi:Putative F0F1-ATPase subunit (ATPase_gene1) [Poriferisphaera corsica]|uniref:F0F1-ATPase subunit (ATPase_gene1) n=1 Tax=Poriferisphaera corsica TaxID=2528020 RepID=A0A517YRI2_9BACT|nr:AtpZ/AtpI family protein [Poriferisphaera corsica]QDU32832.1 Putative F0F1-ATPase subunit (ATPase_gene1) [Poriferisphaera corsica]